MNKLKALLILSLIVLAGCTNVTGDVSRTINQPPSSSLNSDTLFSAASDFFVRAGYECTDDGESGRFRCSKALRDLYIHQTRAVVEIYPGDDKDSSYLLVTTRWDEGLIPSEFISSDFTNSDVEGFCEHLRADRLGFCRPG